MPCIHLASPKCGTKKRGKIRERRARYRTREKRARGRIQKLVHHGLSLVLGREQPDARSEPLGSIRYIVRLDGAHPV